MSPKEKTKKELALAIKRIRLGRPQVVSSDRKLSISAVAEEAQVSAALIHNSHPEIADEIRALTGKVRRVAELDSEKERKIKALTLDLEEKDEMIKKLARQNFLLSQENQRLDALMKKQKTVPRVGRG